MATDVTVISNILRSIAERIAVMELFVILILLEFPKRFIIIITVIIILLRF